MSTKMLSSTLHNIILALCAVLGTSQTLPNPSGCVANSGITAFPACEYMYGQFSICSQYAAVTDAYDFYHCYCEQRYFDAIWDCDSEQRLCLGASAVDANFDSPVSIWHSVCDSLLLYSVTTPVLSSIIAPYNINYCSTVQSNCAELTSARIDCTTGYQPGQEASLTSCLCATPLLSFAYTCSFLGNISCIQTPATISQMAEYGHCSDLGEVLPGPSSVNPRTTFESSNGAAPTMSDIYSIGYSPVSLTASPVPSPASSPASSTFNPISTTSTTAGAGKPAGSTTSTGGARRQVGGLYSTLPMWLLFAGAMI